MIYAPSWLLWLGRHSEYHKAHDDSKTLYFRPVAPTNHLKMHPWWNDEAQDLAKEVRGAVA